VSDVLDDGMLLDDVRRGIDGGDLRYAIARETGVHVPIPRLLAVVLEVGYRAIGDDAGARLGMRV
jgi:hypothetical protein